MKVEEKGAVPSEVVEKSSTLHTASFTPHPRGSGLSGEKEIEEIFNDVVEAEQRYHEYCLTNTCHDCEYYGDGECDNHIRAEYLYNAGYRKQSEGENIGTVHPVDEFVCSKCGIHLEGWTRVVTDEDDGELYYYEYEFKYCPNCGAKMKGGAE